MGAGAAQMKVDGRRPDVIVVGGGITGCSIAYRLAQRGRRVLLLDRRGIASGASGRNGGMTGAGPALHFREAMAVYALTRANLALLKELPEELGGDFSLRLPGTMDVAVSPEEWEHLKASAEQRQAAGIEVHLLDPDEARRQMPALSDRIHGAEFFVDRGHLWPFALVNAFAAAARRHGATIRTGVNVDQLLRRGECVVGVSAGGEAIEADEVVLATNAYTPHLLPELPAGALVPARGQILVTEPLPPLLGHPFACNFDKEYGRQTPDGKILCGGFRRLDHDQGLGHEAERVSPPVLAGIGSCLVGLFPVLRGVRVVRAWAGIMGFTADGLPLIGRYPPLAGLTVAAGFNGGGFSWGAIVGKVVADLLDGRAPGFDLEQFRPERFAEGGTVWRNPYTVGEDTAVLGAPAEPAPA